jgi:hypothetical protein
LPAKDEEVIALFNNLSDLAESLKIRISSLSRYKEIKKTKREVCTEFSRNMRLGCQYDQLGEFINYLEFMDMFVKVTYVRISPARDPYTLNVDLTFSTFVSNKEGSL